MKIRPKLLLLVSAAGILPGHAKGAGDFVEKGQPFLRSALVISEKPGNVVRRGVIIRLGEDLWACFDPDLLRHAAVWKSPPNQPPLTLDSMAAVSYPDKQAKAEKAPALSGTLLSSSPELPGIGITERAATDPRKGTLTDGKTKVGPLPAAQFRWLGISLRGDQVELGYRVGTREIRETNRALTPGLIERVISISPGKETVAIHLDSSPGIISVSGAAQSVSIETGDLPHFLIRGSGTITALTNPTRGTFINIAPSRDAASFQILRSTVPIANPPRLAPIPEVGSATPVFPEKIESTSPVPEKNSSPIAARTIQLPFPNPWNRVIRTHRHRVPFQR
jgi:hypothetical protein